jgi:hypothetical protein
MIDSTLGASVLAVPLVVDQIQESLREDGMTIALVALVFLFCLYTFLKGLGLFWEAYKIKSRDVTPANEVYLADGVVEVEGTAEVLDETVQSPYTNTDCLVYEYKKERDDGHTGDDTHDSGMTTVDSGSEGVPFLLADDSGDVAVDPTGAEYMLGTDDVEGGTREKKHENRIEPGDSIHVVGQKRAAAERREDGLDQQRCYVGDGDRISQYRITDGSETWAVVGLLAKGVFVTLFTGGVAVISGLFLLDLFGFFVFA